MLKAVILVGGIHKGTRFRPLSLDVPKPLFPIAGYPIIQHHVEAALKLKELKEILIIGSYPASSMDRFIYDVQNQYPSINIRYLQEFTELGTAGGIYHFRDQIRAGNPNAFFVLNGDVCCDFPLQEIYDYHKSRENAILTLMSTEATREQSLNFGCLVTDKETGAVQHFVEKPHSYVSHLINCGIYVMSAEVFPEIAKVFYARQESFQEGNGGTKDRGFIQLEQDVLSPLAGTGRLYTYISQRWWSQVKTAGSAIYANRHYLDLSMKNYPERFAKKFDCTIIPNVYIHPSANVHETAVLGPNVSISAGVTIGPGVRIKESIILENAIVEDHTLILHSIIGRASKIGKWARIEGTQTDPDPNKQFTKMENKAIFNKDGKLNPSVTILGYQVVVPSELIILNSVVLPLKSLTRSFKNEIIL
jgi:mannose-1-phosphate guanylyltransferase